MPTRNIIKVYAPQSYYHLYTRGVNKQTVFRDDEDKTFFLGLLKRYLAPDQPTRKRHAPYVSFAGTLDLLAYCLMDNHLHLLFYLHDDTQAIAGIMRRILTTYSMYFNKKYERVGPLFQSRYLATRIDSDAYLHHISRYIHRNPRRWRTYKYSSLRYYTGESHASWINPQKIMELFDNDPDHYLDFVSSVDEGDRELLLSQLAHE